MDAKKDRRRLAGRIVRELAVIVTGVMIALWADGQVSARAERRIEASRLDALDRGIDRTLRDLRAYGEEVEGIDRALRRLMSWRGAPMDTDSVRWALGEGFIAVPVFEPQLNIYEDLKSSGELALFEDPQVRQDLAAMDAGLARLQRASEDLERVQQLNFDRYMISHTDMVYLFGQMLQLTSPDRPVATDVRFLADREFWNLVVFKLDLMNVLADEVERTDSVLVRTARSIDGRLGAIQ